MNAAAITVRTPDGKFTLLASAAGVLASGWTDDLDSLIALVHPSLRPARADVALATGGGGGPDGGAGELLSPAAEAVTAYYDGQLDAPSEVRVHQRSGDFRMLAWDALRTVRAGDRLTYTDYATLAGRPAAVRAAAGACAMNAVALFVPCHRIVRTDGGLGGFRYGLAIKRSLLDREGDGASPHALF